MPMPLAASRPDVPREPSHTLQTRSRKGRSWLLALAGVLLALGLALLQKRSREAARNIAPEPVHVEHAPAPPTVQVVTRMVTAPDAAIVAPADDMEPVAPALEAESPRKRSRTPRARNAEPAAAPHVSVAPPPVTQPSPQPTVRGRRYRTTPEAPRADEF